MKVKLSRIALIASIVPAAAIAGETDAVLKGQIAILQGQVTEITKRSQGVHITKAYKEETQKLGKLMTVINRLVIKGHDSGLLSQVAQKLASRISDQMSRRDACENGFTTLAAQQCITASLPQPRNKIKAVSAGNKILFAGGETPTGATSAIDILDTETNSWTSGSLPTTKGDVGVESIGADKAIIYRLDRTNSVPTILVDLFDSAMNSWSSSSITTNLPSIRSTTAANKILFWTSGANQSEVDVFDSDKRSWTRIPTPANTPWTTSFIVAEKAAFVRSSTPDFGKGSTVDLYDANQSTWSTITIPLEYQGTFTAGISAYGKIYLVARESESGDDQSLGKYMCQQKLMVHDIQSSSWNQRLIPGCGSNWSVAESGSKIVFAGEAYGNSKNAFVLDSITGRWDSVDLSETGASMQIAVAGSKLVIISGESRAMNTAAPSGLNIYESSHNIWTGKSPIKVYSDDPPEALGRLNYVRVMYGKLGGWAADHKNPASILKVKFYLDGDNTQGKYIGETVANIDGFDNNVAGSHGFAFNLPINLIDNRRHTLYAYAVDSQGSETQLLGSPFKYAAFKSNQNGDSYSKFQRAFVNRPYPCTQGCHMYTYETLMAIALSDFDVDNWSVGNNFLIKKMQPGAHTGGIFFDHASMEAAKLWLEHEFREFPETWN